MEQQTLPQTKEQFEQALQSYLSYLKKDYIAWQSPDQEKDPIRAKVKQEAIDRTQYVVTRGPKFIKVIHQEVVDGKPVHRAVHTFIDAEGNIWKAAGWHAPAKNFTRGSIFDAESYKHITWAGGC